MKDLFRSDSHKLHRDQIFKTLLQDKKLGVSSKNIDEFPEPYFKQGSKIKAIILGADPSNPRKEKLKFVFGLEKDNSLYFSSILYNLSALGLDLTNIYVQNLCPNYFKEVTDENNDYEEIASKYWLPFLKEELNFLFPKEIPVLVTAWKPLVVIAPQAKVYEHKKSEIYRQSVVFETNNLGRPVFALFRGGRRKHYYGYFDLNFPDFVNYREMIKFIVFPKKTTN